MQGSLSIERMCQVGQVSRASFYRSLKEEMPAEDMEVRSQIQRIVLEHRRRYWMMPSAPSPSSRTLDQRERSEIFSVQVNFHCGMKISRINSHFSSEVPPVLLPDQVLKILFVFADPVQQFSVGHEFPRDRHRPGPGVGFGIVDRKPHFHVPEIGAPESFCDVQRIAVCVAAVVKPRLFVDADGIDHQSVTLPFPDRIPEPRGIGVFRQRAAVSENLPMLIEFLVEHHGFPQRLDDLERDVRNQHGIRHAMRQAVQLRVICAPPVLALLVKGCGRWTHGNVDAFAGEITDVTVAIGVPDAGELRLPIWRSWSRCQ